MSHTITFYWAFFGEKEEAHDCLAISESLVNRQGLIEFLATRTDLPSELPPGMKLQPFLTGMPFKDEYYIFSKTFEETRIKRPGMAFTYCLIVPQSSLVYVNDLQEIFSHFPSELPPEKNIEMLITNPISLEVKQIHPLPNHPLKTSTGYPSFLKKIASNTVKQEHLPTVIIGTLPVFENILQQLWIGMGQKSIIQLRKKFFFRGSLGPQDIKKENNKLLLVHAHEEAQSKWRYHEPREQLVHSTTNGDIQADTENFTPLERLLLGLPQNSTFDLESFIQKELDIQVQRFADLKPIQAIFNDYQQLDTLNGTGTLAFLRRFNYLLPNPDKAKVLKSRVLSRFTELIATGEYHNYESLRFTPMPGIDQYENLTAKAIKKGGVGLIEKGDVKTISSWVNVVIDSDKKHENLAWWNATITDIIAEHLNIDTPRKAELFWQIFQQISEPRNDITSQIEAYFDLTISSKNNRKGVIQLPDEQQLAFGELLFFWGLLQEETGSLSDPRWTNITTEYEAESFIFQSFPKPQDTNDNLIEVLQAISQKKGWHLLHAWCLLALREPNAMETQMKLIAASEKAKAGLEVDNSSIYSLFLFLAKNKEESGGLDLEYLIKLGVDSNHRPASFVVLSVIAQEITLNWGKLYLDSYLDVNHPDWLKIWWLVIEKFKSSQNTGVPATTPYSTANIVLASILPQQKVWAFFDLIAGFSHQNFEQSLGKASIAILQFISEQSKNNPDSQGLIDILHYSSQEALLDNVSRYPVICNNIEESITNTYLEVITKGGSLDAIKVLPKIRQKVANKKYLEKFFQDRWHEVSQILKVYEHFELMSENILCDLIDYKWTTYYDALAIDAFELEYLGLYIKDNGYKKAAMRIFNKVRLPKNSQFKLTLAECEDLLEFGFFDWLLGKKYLSNAQKHQPSRRKLLEALVKEATSLYSTRQKIENLWERAGGDVSRLDWGKPGKEIWADAVDLIEKNGGGGTISFTALIEEMKSEFNRDELDILKDHLA